MKRKGRGSTSTGGCNEDGRENAREKSPKKDRKVAVVKLKDRDLYLDNDKTEGGRVKLECEVIKTYWEKVDTDKGKRPKSPNLNCRVETLGAIIDDFGVVERRWVIEMGFGGLLFLAGKRLPRMLCYWLMTKVDPIRRLLVINQKHRYQLLPQSVHWVFGLPCGGKKVPDETDTLATGRCIEVFEKYGSYTSQGYRSLSLQNVVADVIKKHNEDDDSAEFKLAFLILLLGDFLCPSSCTKLSHNLWPAVTVFNEAHEYDWCGFVLENLMGYARLFCQIFYRDGYAKGSGGCTYFLAVFYIDHLDREPVGWGVFPRIKAWSNEEVNAVKVEDRLRDENGVILSKGDFGELGCINVAYGEVHPLGGRDTMGPTGAIDEAVKAVLTAVRAGGVPQMQTVGASRAGSGVAIDPNEIFPNRKVRRRLGPADKSNPRSRLAAKKGVETAGPEADSRRSVVPEEVIVEDEPVEDEPGEDQFDDGPPGFNGMNRNGGDDDPLANLVFSQEIFGEGGVLSQSQGSDSLFRSLYQDYVVGSGGPKLFDEADDLGDGVVVEGMPRTSPMNNSQTEKIGDALSQQQQITVNLSADKENDSVAGGDDRGDGKQLGDGRLVDDEMCGGNERCFRADLNAELNAGEETWGDEARDGGPKRIGGEDMFRGGERVSNEKADQTGAPIDGGDTPPTAEDFSSQAEQPSPHKSRPKREKRLSQNVKDKDFYVDQLPRCNPNSRPRLTKFVMTTGALIADSKNCTGDELVNIHDMNIPMIQCDGQFADVMNCYSVLSPYCDGVDDCYVRTAAKLYTKMWKAKFEGRGLRYMMDPCFALKIEKEKGAPTATSWADTVKLCNLYAKDFVGVAVDWFNVIFVPVLFKNHWWCVGVSVNTQSVWVIDSVSLRCGVKEKHFLRKVLSGVELFFQTLEPNYKTGTILGWPCKTVQMESQPDGNSCGVRMLLAIKSCADRFLPEFLLRSPIEEERQWLLNDDVMHPLNEVKAEVRKKIEEHMSNLA